MGPRYCSCRPGHRPLTVLEGPGAVPGPPLPGRQLRRAGQRPLGPPAGPGAVLAARPRAGRPSPCWTRPARAGRAGVAVDGRRLGAVAGGPSSRTGTGQRLHRPVGGPRARAAGGATLRRAVPLHRGLGQVQPALLAGPLPRTSSSSSSLRLHRARTRPSRSRTASAGGWRYVPRGPARQEGGPPARRGDRARLVCRQPPPGAGGPRRQRQPSAPGRGGRWPRPPAEP